jgi:hypothetical protein
VRRRGTNPREPPDSILLASSSGRAGSVFVRVHRLLYERDRQRKVAKVHDPNGHPIRRATPGVHPVVECALRLSLVDHLASEPNVHPVVSMKVGDLGIPDGEGTSMTPSGRSARKARDCRELGFKLFPNGHRSGAGRPADKAPGERTKRPFSLPLALAGRGKRPGPIGGAEERR